jgi:hypothetical protein
LEGQIVALYGRGPIATEELKATATNILGEGKELDRLMADVNERVSKLPPDTERIMTPIEADAPAMPSKYLYLGIALGVGAVVAAILFMLARRSRAKRVAGSKLLQ